MNSKKQAGVWIDGKKAIVVILNERTAQVSEITSHIEDSQHHEKQSDKGSFMGHHHISHEKTFEERKKNQLHAYLIHVIASLSGITDLYICGPGEIKIHLKKAVESDYNLRSSLREVNACEQMTENQLVAKVKDFFGQL